MKPRLETPSLATVCLLCMAWTAPSQADASRPGGAESGRAAEWAFKFTSSYYATTHQPGAIDLNLRANHGPHALWFAYYRRGSEFEQARTGYEYTAETSIGRVVSSVVLATHGFAGASINAEIGGDMFALLGLGRTNLKDYFNLTFDPNDSVVFGLGTRLVPHTTLSLFRVQDDRLDTGQRVNHLVWRYLPDDRQRWTVDFSAKRGSLVAGSETVSGNAWSLTYDFKDVFVRLARDGKVNFSPEDMTRVSAGFRF